MEVVFTGQLGNSGRRKQAHNVRAATGSKNQCSSPNPSVRKVLTTCSNEHICDKTVQWVPETTSTYIPIY